MDVQRTVRGDRWKLIEYPKAARTQLFDLLSDPDEEHDLSADPRHAAQAGRLRDALRAWQRQKHDPLVKP
jgi:arylsulfatase A-like enzyme